MKNREKFKTNKKQKIITTSKSITLNRYRRDKELHKISKNIGNFPLPLLSTEYIININEKLLFFNMK